MIQLRTEAVRIHCLENTFKRFQMHRKNGVLHEYRYMHKFRYSGKGTITKQNLSKTSMVGWLFWFNGPSREYLCRTVSQKKGRKRRERTDESKMSKQPPPAPTANAVGPCPTVSQMLGCPGTESLPCTIAPPDHPLQEFERR